MARLSGHSSVRAVTEGIKGHNGAMSVALDKQITQPDKQYLTYRGVYFNATAQYAVPDMNIYHQYYQFVVYSFGLFRSRPLDMMVINANRTQFSRTALNTLQALPSSLNPQFGSTPFDDSTAISGTYGLHLRRGMYFSTNLGYTRHPAFAPKLASPVIGSAVIAIFF